MNFKTTTAMMIVLALLLGWFLFEQPHKQQESETTPATPAGSTVAEKSVFEDAPTIDDVRTVTVNRAGAESWRFERVNPEDSQDDGGWQMVEPNRFSVQQWQVDNIVRTVTDLKYQIEYATGGPNAVTAGQAGLDPPKIEIVLEDGDGTKLVLRVGKPVPPDNTYVQTDSTGSIYVAKRSLSTLVKESVNDYRDRSLISFASGDAVSLNILYRPKDEDPIEYRLVKNDGDDWVFQKPFDADADDSAIERVMAAASRLRATEWIEHNPQDGLGVFGLKPAKLEVEIVAEKPIDESEAGEPDSQSDDAENGTEDESEVPAPKTLQVQTTRYAFSISQRGPLGKGSAVYCKLADQDVVATVTTTVADRFIPELEKWRNMDVVPTPVTNADKLQIQIRAAPQAERFTTLTKDDRNNWVFEDADTPAEKLAVDDLLKTIDNLKALNFVDGADPDNPKFGLVDPRARIVITIPGHDQPETITVGNPTDDVSKRVYYVRRGESQSIAKVRADDIAILERSPNEYIDRRVVSIAASDIKHIEITRLNAVTGEKEVIGLIQTDGDWRMSSPIEAEVDNTAVLKLATILTDLRAAQVVSRDDPQNEYGLNQPTSKLAITYKGPPIITIEDDSPDPQPPESRHVEINISDRDGKVYATRSDRTTVYRLRRADLQATEAEFHNKTALAFEPSQAVSVSVTSGTETHTFEMKAAGWIYAAEPDLPIDAKKVTDLLLQIADLRIKRYVDYGAGNLAGYGLDNPSKTVKVKVENQEEIALLLSNTPCPNDKDQSVYAMVEGTRNVFLMTPDTVSRISVSLGDFEKEPRP